MESTPRFPLLRIMLGNAFLLSGIYLVLGLAVETLRRLTPAEWVDWLSLVLDSLPGRTLLLLGVMPRLHELYYTQGTPGWVLRLVFAGTTIAIIFALALVVGMWMFVLRWLLERFERRHTNP